MKKLFFLISICLLMFGMVAVAQPTDDVYVESPEVDVVLEENVQVLPVMDTVLVKSEVIIDTLSHVKDTLEESDRLLVTNTFIVVDTTINTSKVIATNYVINVDTIITAETTIVGDTVITEKAVVAKDTVRAPAVKKPRVKKPDVKKPDVKKPDVKKPAVEKPAVEKPAVAEPVVEEQATPVDTLMDVDAIHINVVVPVNVIVPVQKDTIVIQPASRFKPSKPVRVCEDIESWESSGAISKKMSLTQPNEDKIKADLVGRVVSEHPDGYLAGAWMITIEEAAIKNIEIVETSEIGQYLYYDVNVTLQAEGSSVLVSCELQYEVGSCDWELKTMLSKEMNFVKTGIYDGCITVREVLHPEVSDEMVLALANHCDVTLIVAGEYFDGTEVKKFIQLLPGNSMYYVNDLHIQDVKIDLVELPF